jgi:hypothetical protein
MNARTALVVFATSLVGCTALHEQEQGCYALSPVRPTGILRDECQLLADTAVTLGARLTQSGYILDIRFRFTSPAQGQPIDVEMAGSFDFSRATFSADGTAANIVLPIAGQSCQPQQVNVHLDATSDPVVLDRFSGLIRITTSTPRPEACVCQAWFEYLATLTTSGSICP